MSIVGINTKIALHTRLELERCPLQTVYPTEFITLPIVLTMDGRSSNPGVNLETRLITFTEDGPVISKAWARRERKPGLD